MLANGGTTMSVSRRSFVGGFAAALGYIGVGRDIDLFAQGRTQGGGAARPGVNSNDYDSFAHLSSNENCWGPPESVMKAMNNAWKYSNRYGYPDGGIVQEIAKHHGVKPENILLTAGSGEVLDVVGTTFLPAGKKVLGVEPTYSTVYQHATSIKTSAIKLPLAKDYRQDIPAMIKAANVNAAQLGFVYLCNPNNPTGQVVTAKEVKQLLDGIPKDMPVLIDEAYHHFVEPGVRDVGAVCARGTTGDHRPHVLEDRGPRRHAARLRHCLEGDDRQDAALQHGQHQRAGEARRRRRAQGHGVAGEHQEDGHRPPQEDHLRAQRLRLRDDSVGDQLLHGLHRPRGSAGHPGIPGEEGPGRPAVPADDDAHARVDRHGRRDGAVHDRVQGDLPGQDAEHRSGRIEFRIPNSEFRIREGGGRRITALFLWQTLSSRPR
jgi:hypothetical protein